MEKFNQAYRQLNDRQRRAVDTIDGPVMVIAGPGTGKTQLLAVRVANILHKAAVQPQNILCLTFTESGQAAMRDRLMRYIGADAYHVTISTYHAFGNDLIRRFPEYTDASLGQRPIDDLLHDEILRRVCDGLPYSNPLKNTAVYLSDLKSLISDAKRAMLTPGDIRDIVADNQLFLDAINPRLPEIFISFQKISKSTVPCFENLLAAAQAVPAHNRMPAPHLQAVLCRELQAALDEWRETGKTSSITKWKNAWLARDATNNFVVAGERINRRTLAAAVTFERYEQALDQAGLFDYDDMILRAVTALETNDDFRYTLQEQYQYILLDEFQDTNAAQFRLIELLTDNPVNEGRPNVLAVGDDDQAIYAFQGASYSNMRHFLDRFNGAAVIPLTDNYRSHADILHAAESVSAQIADRLHYSVTAISKDLVAAGRALPPAATIEYHELPSDVAELSWTADRIASLIAEGTPANEIAVLAPKHKLLEALVPYLRARAIPIRYEKRDNILNDRFIRELIAMARLTEALARGDETEADSLWPEVLSYDCWQLATETIWHISWQARQTHQSWRDCMMHEPRLKPIALFFTRLSLLSKTETLETILDYLTGRAELQLNDEQTAAFTAPFYECYFSAEARQNQSGPFWRMLTHFTVLRQRLREYRADEDRALMLPDLTAFVGAHDAADIKIMSTVPFRDQQSAVQLMTAYKAKGLEFDAVFVIGCQDEIWGSKARSHSSNIGLPKNLVHIRYAGATEDERLRLFFVALTRARSHLYLTSFRSTYTGKQTTRLKYLQVSDDDNGQLISGILPEPHRLVRQPDVVVGDRIEDLAQFWHERHSGAIQQPQLKELLSTRLDNFRLSPSHLNSFLDTVYGGPEAFLLNTLLRFPQSQSLDGAYGNAIHETMEWLQRQRATAVALPAPEQIAAAFTDFLRRKRLSPQHTEQLLERGKAALAAYLAARGHDILPNDRAEVSLRHEGVIVQGMRLSGTIDKLRIDRQAKTIIVTDYKTGRAYDSWKPEPKLAAYRRQLYMYKIMLEHAPSFAGYTVTEGILDFIEPDEDGALQRLTLRFSDTEYDRVLRLARAVWQRIILLDLPDISAYPASLTGIKQFEDDLLAGTAGTQKK